MAGIGSDAVFQLSHASFTMVLVEFIWLSFRKRRASILGTEKRRRNYLPRLPQVVSSLLLPESSFYALLEVGVISTDGSDDPCQHMALLLSSRLGSTNSVAAPVNSLTQGNIQGYHFP
jgi:hypothetical protein